MSFILLLPKGIWEILMKMKKIKNSIIPGHNATTPAMMPADLPMRMESASPSYPQSPNQKVSTKSKAKASRSPRERRGRSQRNSASARTKVNIAGPLSEITAHFKHVPVRDMETYVNRPIAARLEEVRKRKSGQKKEVTRPMNGFLLYRSAYTARCKEYLGVENHQDISRVIGASWHMETKQLQDTFKDLAKIESANHAIAFPGYKFQPKKDSAVVRRPELTPPRSVSAGDMGSPNDWDDLGDPDFSLPPTMHRRTQSFEISSRASSPFDGYQSTLTSSFDPAWNTSFPSQSLPTNLSSIQPDMLHATDMDEMKYGIHGAHPISHDMPSGINGIPGGSHEDLCQNTQPFPVPVGSGHMDPQLLQYNQDHQVPHDHTDMPSSHLYQMGFDEANYISTSMPSGHNSPMPYHGLELGESSWDYMDTPPSSSF